MTSKPKEHRIKTMKDFLALTREERIRMIPDLIAWADVADAVNADAGLRGWLRAVPEFVWIDDGKPAQVSGAQIGRHRVMFKDAAE